MATGNKILVAMRSWVEEQLAALRAWIDAQLSNKVPIYDHGDTETDLLSYLPEGEHRCDIWRNTPPDYPGTPGTCKVINFNSNAGYLGWTSRILKSPYEGKVWVNSCSDGSWGGWEAIATATPPQEYGLPPKNGFTADNTANMIRTQDGVVNIYGTLRNDTQAITEDLVIAALPIGYEPTADIDVPMTFYPSLQSGYGKALSGGNIAIRLGFALSDTTVIFNWTWRGSANSALQSQVRMPTTRMTLAAIPEDPVDKCMCVLSADGSYVGFVMVTITQDELGALYTVHYYELQDGERLIDSQTPPAMRPHAGADGLVRPRWDDETATWTEGATAEEIAAWEAEHPAPEPVPAVPTVEERVKLVEAQIGATNDRQDFVEDCIAEMAVQVYDV